AGDPRPLHSFPTRRSSDLLLKEDRSKTRSSSLCLRKLWKSATTSISALSSGFRTPRTGQRMLLPARSFALINNLSILWRPSSYRSEEHTSELQSREHLVCR